MIKHKGVAAWLALLLGSLGVHRAYLYGLRDRWLWLYPLPTLTGLVGLTRFQTIGQHDTLAAWAMPLLGLMLAQGALCAIVYGLTSDERWNARFNPQQAPAPTRWLPVLAAVAALLLGGTALMATIAFSAQRYFELSAEAAGQ